MAKMDEATMTMVRNLEEKTGKKFAAWLGIVKKSGLETHGQIVKMLKSDHGLTHGYANLVAHKALESDAGSAGDSGSLVDAQYSGKKEGRRPSYDAGMKGVEKFGKDVELAPKKAYVSVRRKKQFAIVQPSTATRVDVGINLKGKADTKRLEKSGSFNAMVSHRVRLESAKDVVKERLGGLKEGYERAG